MGRKPVPRGQGTLTLPGIFSVLVNGGYSGPRHAKHSQEEMGGALQVPTRGKDDSSLLSR